MHRHGYKGKKFSRQTDQRRALLKGLATSLVLHGEIETTLPKAKAILPRVEVLITKAKRGDLHNRRQVISALSTLEAANKLFDEVAPKLTNRTSGHLRITRTSVRVGDNVQLASVSFVDPVYDSKSVAQATQLSPKADVGEKKTELSTKTRAPKKITAINKHLDHKPTVSVRKSGTR